MKNGVNIIGYARSEKGLGEGCRLTANALSNTNLNWSVYNWERNNPSRNEDRTLDEKLSVILKYKISIININADQLIQNAEYFPEQLWNTYRIGIWYWELDEFPDEWDLAFDLVDEIWAPTRFIQECLKKKARCPVLYMPPGIERKEPSTELNREYFGLPNHMFLFLNMYDVYSYSSRKNPEATVNAFKKAFTADDNSVGLVLKLNNAQIGGKELKKISQLVGDYKNIFIIAQIMSRDEINGLINSCDAVISLHRSEGLGLLCEEAMFFGKPVIATGWSGNVDFMNKDNSCLVDYSMVPVDYYYGLEGGSDTIKWAEPNIDQAAQLMRKLFDDIEYRQIISNNGREYIRNEFSTKKCGKKMENRINTILSSNYIINKRQFTEMKNREERNYNLINQLPTINYLYPISVSGKFKPVKKIVLKVLRKICKPVIIPLIEQQNNINVAISKIVMEQKYELEMLKEDLNNNNLEL